MSTSAVGATRTLAAFTVGSSFNSLPAVVVDEAKRALLNWAGCAVGGSAHPAVDRAWDALSDFAGAPQASVLGRGLRTDILHAALLNGISSHVLDFDDTHPLALVHPSGPVASAVFALAEHRRATGAELINAFVIGVEVQCRIARAVLPAHYDQGWHITATAGIFGAAAACARLLALSEQQTTWALGLAATQSAGLREMFGSMAKSLHPGRAAQNGLSSALMARANFTSAETGIEGKRGFAQVMSSSVDLEQCTAGLGNHYDLLQNMYKPYACGLVIHPVIDACILLRNEHGVLGAEVDAITLTVNPLVLEVTAKTAPVSGLEGKFSVYHSAAVALLDGAADEAQFSDARVLDAEVVALRVRIHTRSDSTIRRDAAKLQAKLKDGMQIDIDIDHCSGSECKPMSNQQLDAKFMGQCRNVLGPERAKSALDQLRSLELVEDLRSCMAMLA